MRSLLYTTFIIFLLGISLAGCKRRQNTALMLAGNANAELGDAQHQRDDFDRSFELLNSLDESPCLPNTPGYETLVSTADRLDKWIRNQKPDETWKPDALFQEIEQTAANAAETARKIIQALALLRGDTVLDDNEQPLVASETLETERQTVTTGLEQLAVQTQTLASLADLQALNDFARALSDFQRQFAALETLPNLNAAGVRAFARRLDFQAEVFASSAAIFESFSVQLKTDGLFISTSDIEYLKQSAWMRGLAGWTCGEQRVLLEQAVQMGDWVVRNIEIHNTYPFNTQYPIVPQYPWQTILLGYGTVQDRTAVFLELLRQWRIDAALLSVPDPRDPSVPFLWGVGVLLDGEVYVFLLNYGLPIPNAEGAKIGDNGSLQISNVATLSQLQQDDSLLRRFDLSEDMPFPLTAEMLKQTSAYLFLTPESVSMRMKVLEPELNPEKGQVMVLYTDPHELRRRFLAASGIDAVEFWKYPIRAAFEQRFDPMEFTNEALSIFLVQRPRVDLDAAAVRQHYPLWSGRVLYFKGAIGGQDNAIIKYQNVRVSDREMIQFLADPAFRNNPSFRQQLEWLTIQASYWLGSALFESGAMSAAKDTLTGIRLNSLNTWRDNTEYLLGRIAEREGRYEDARRHYANTTASMSGFGNTIRARWLPTTDKGDGDEAE